MNERASYEKLLTCEHSITYNSLVRITIAYVVCVNFIHELRDLQFKVDSERQIFEKLCNIQLCVELGMRERVTKNYCRANIALLTTL